MSELLTNSNDDLTLYIIVAQGSKYAQECHKNYFKLKALTVVPHKIRHNRYKNELRLNWKLSTAQ